MASIIVSITLYTGKTYRVGAQYDDTPYKIKRIDYHPGQRLYQVYPDAPRGVITIPSNLVDHRKTVKH
jgi:hypothetical protein